MSVYKHNIKPWQFLNTTTTTTSGIIAVNNIVKYNNIVFCFQKHPVNSMTWLRNLFNTFYGVKMSQSKDESLPPH